MSKGKEGSLKEKGEGGLHITLRWKGGGSKKERNDRGVLQREKKEGSQGGGKGKKE